MNIALFGYILAWLGVIYCVIAVIAILSEYSKLSYSMQQRASINFNIPLIVLVISVAYIATYHIS